MKLIHLIPKELHVFGNFIFFFEKGAEVSSVTTIYSTGFISARAIKKMSALLLSINLSTAICLRLSFMTLS